MADLTYNLATGLLTGRVDGTPINAYGGSGGRAGSKQPGTLNWWLANNPFATSVKLNAESSNAGGPLPLGDYTLRLHERRNNWIRLVPASSNQMYGRAGFAIHGRGDRGSDGCIVPTDFANVMLLCRLVTARAERNGPPVTLQVIATGQDLDAQLRTA